ncbi:cytochrome b/b6 domain-containing protein [Photobacterium makurazakiensis]|uniref:cytochrome b/b6 domain-containing protein n=1 Tax=Photobacterium makurazakiensis TaxID=2910234 RepID=UPI003D12B11E
MKIWDLPTRLYHWLQAILFIGLTFSGFTGNGPHELLGLGLFCLIAWRIGWGLIGSDTSRFKQFIYSPQAVVKYFKGRHPATVGHNPAGGWMVVLMLTGLLIQCLTGLMLAGFFDSLPILSTALTDNAFMIAGTLHGLFARLLPVLILLHLAAIILYKLKKKPLVWAMISGKQKLTLAQQLSFASNRKALMLFVASLSVTMTIVAYS